MCACRACCTRAWCIRRRSARRWSPPAQLDKTKFPNSQVIVKGNLVGVVAPTEWEAIQAAEQVAGATKWTEWKGLPGNAKLYQHLREEADWTTAPVAKSDKNPKAMWARRSRRLHKKLSATYQLSYMKHAPIGPTMAVADVKPDGTVHIYTHNQNPQALRGEIAMMLGTTPDHVIVHSYPGPGHYGRSNGGNAGAEDEAVHPVASRRQAGARAVDARRRYAVVHAIAGRFLRRSDRHRRKRQDGRVSNRPLHARHAG